MNRKINILFVSTSFPKDSKDWKSVFISQLLHSFSSRLNLSIAYWGPFGQLPKNIEYLCKNNEKKWLSWLMASGGIIHLIRQKRVHSLTATLKLLSFLKEAYKCNQDIDIYHINWLQNALPLIYNRKPAVISVLGSDFGLLKIPFITTLLRNSLKRRECVIAPNAEWMVEGLQKRFGDIARIIPVHLGLNDYWFEVERELRDGENHKWLVISRLTKKKIGPLFEWAENIFYRNNDHQLHLFGPMQEQMVIPNWVNYHGPTTPHNLCLNWFPQASGLLTLSQHDEGRPQVMLEAMAAGLPIIASDNAAHRDFISHGQTGMLVNNQYDLDNAIKWIANSENNKMIAQNARTWVKNTVGTWQDCADRYIKVYNILLNNYEP